MPETNPSNGSRQHAQQQSGLLIFLVLCCAAVIALGVAAWFYFGASRRQAYPEPAALIAVMNPVERDYLKNIQVRLSLVQQNENYAHERQVILKGEIVNLGTKGIGELQLRVQFFDGSSQAVRRETAAMWLATDQGMAAGEKRSFSLSFENIPASWNQRPPDLDVIHLQLLAQ